MTKSPIKKPARAAVDRAEGTHQSGGQPKPHLKRNAPWAQCITVGPATLYLGDCTEVMAALDAESMHACVTDPPYELGFMGKAWDKADGVASDPATWEHVLRLLTPGGHCVAFAGSRTYHSIAMAIERSGFDIRDQLMWLYGSGFPKSHDIAKCIDKRGGYIAARPGSRSRAMRNGRWGKTISGRQKGRPSSMMRSAGMAGVRR